MAEATEETPWWNDVLNTERKQLTDDQVAAAFVAGHDWGAKRDHAPNGQFIQVDDKSHRSRHILAHQAGVSQFKIERAREIQRSSSDLLKAVGLGTIGAAEALSRIKTAPITAQPPADGLLSWRATISTQPSTTIQRDIKDRMIRVLSRIHGLCRGFDTLSIPALRGSCDAKEIKEWANMARSAARVLRGFAADLSGEQHEAHN